MAALTTKFPSRRTISRMSRSEVEARLTAMGITLPPARRIRFYDDELPPYCSDSPDCAGITEAEWRDKKEIERNDLLGTAGTAEHPQAREKLFTECLKRAVSREGLEVLNKIIKGSLMDSSTARGLEVWTPWRFRNATRPAKEAAVIEFLSQKEDDEPK